MFKKIWSASIVRNFSKSRTWNDVEKSKLPEATTPNPSIISNRNVGVEVTPREYEKLILVWTGKYKSKEEVPSKVGEDVLSKYKSKFRIRVANYMIVALIITCIGVSWAGKERAKKGETIPGTIFKRYEELQAMGKEEREKLKEGK